MVSLALRIRQECRGKKWRFWFSKKNWVGRPQFKCAQTSELLFFKSTFTSSGPFLRLLLHMWPAMRKLTILVTLELLFVVPL